MCILFQNFQLVCVTIFVWAILLMYSFRQRVPVFLYLTSSFHHGELEVNETSVNLEYPTNLDSEVQHFRLIYIKTKKTGSSTMTNILYRFALLHNLNVMTFYRESPSPIHEKELLRDEPRPHFNMIMEHLTFNETYFNAIMPGNKHYISTLRDPFDQLASQIHFKDTRGFTGVPSVRIKDRLEKSFTTLKDYGQTYIKIPKKYTSSSEDLKTYFEILNSKFLLILITEFYDACLVLLKRKLSWTLRDIVYSPLKRGLYTIDANTKKTFTARHKKLKPEEYALFQYFNGTLWNLISKESSNFWSEVKHYQNINKNISSFCIKYYRILRTNIKEVRRVIDTTANLTIDHSAWNKKFTVDPLDCILMKVHKTVFLIMNTVKNFPVLCKYKRKLSKRKINIRTIDITRNHATFNSKYCFPVSTRYRIPVDVLTQKDAYDWDDVFNSH